MLGVRSRFLVAVFSLFISYFCNEAIAEPIGEVDTVGITWCEKQWGSHNAGSMMAMDTIGGNIYIAWSYAPQSFYWSSYSAFNYYTPNLGWVYGDSGLEMFSGSYHNECHSVLLPGNYGGLDDVEIVLASPITYMVRAKWNADSFTTMRIDTVNSPHEFVPSYAIFNNGCVQLLAEGSDGLGCSRLYFGSYVLDPYNFSGWQCVDTSTNQAYCIAVSPVSHKEAISYLRQRVFSDTGVYGLDFDQDIYIISSPDGINWDLQAKNNITNFAESDVFRPFMDVDAIFDYAANIHIAFKTLEYEINRSEPESSRIAYNMCFLWHWSEDLDSFTVAASGWIPNAYPSGFGHYSCFVDKPQMAINPINGYLYMLYERYYMEEHSGNGFGVADQWVTVSTDNGLNWSLGTNITDTHTPYCSAGECASEVQASLYEIANDTLHVVYILDKDGGIYQDHEGWPSQNYVIYQKIPADQIPTTPLIEQFSFRDGPVRCSYMPGDINGDNQTNGGDIVYAVNFFRGGRGLPAVECSCPNEEAPFYGAGDVNGSCSFNGMDVTYYVGYLKGRFHRFLFCSDCPPDYL